MSIMLASLHADSGFDSQGAVRRSSRTHAAGSACSCRRCIQILIFGYAATYDLSDIPYAVLDQDRSPPRMTFCRLGRAGRVSPRRRSRPARRTYGGHRPAPGAAGDADRAGFRAATDTGPSGRHASHCRRAQLQHGRHGDRATSTESSRTSMPTGAIARSGQSANTRHPARLVQSEPGNPLEHGAGPRSPL